MTGSGVHAGAIDEAARVAHRVEELLSGGPSRHVSGRLTGLAQRPQEVTPENDFFFDRCADPFSVFENCSPMVMAEVNIFAAR